MAATTLHSFETESLLTTFEVKTMTEIVEEVEEVAPVLEMRNKAPKMLAVGKTKLQCMRLGTLTLYLSISLSLPHFHMK